MLFSIPQHNTAHSRIHPSTQHCALKHPSLNTTLHTHASIPQHNTSHSRIYPSTQHCTLKHPSLSHYRPAVMPTGPAASHCPTSNTTHLLPCPQERLPHTVLPPNTHTCRRGHKNGCLTLSCPNTTHQPPCPQERQPHTVLPPTLHTCRRAHKYGCLTLSCLQHYTYVSVPTRTAASLSCLQHYTPVAVPTRTAAPHRHAPKTVDELAK